MDINYIISRHLILKSCTVWYEGWSSMADIVLALIPYFPCLRNTGFQVEVAKQKVALHITNKKNKDIQNE